MKKVIAAGHICLDLTPAFPGREVHKVQELLSPGKLIQVGDADIHTGGSVANTGLAMKLLGADVSLVGKIGDDAFGEMIRSIVTGFGAADTLICRKGEATSYSVVLALPGIDRIFLHNPGANDTFCAEDLPEELLSEAALFHFGYPSIMKKMYQGEGEELARILRRARAAGAATSLDLAAVDENSEAGGAPWRRILEHALPCTDFFVPSIEELWFMLNRAHYRKLRERAAGRDITEILDLEEDIAPLAQMCLDLGAKAVLLKCGAPGMYFQTAGAEAIRQISPRLELDPAAWADRKGFERSYVPERILSGTGAGDTSIAAFLTAMLVGETPEECVRLAAAEGACCVAAYDALSGLLPLQELKEKIRAGWKKSGQ